MRRQDWPQELKVEVLGNFRQPAVIKPERTPWHKRRAGMDPNHLVLIRQLPCTVCEGRYNVEAHHLKSGAAARERGLGLKATDRWAVPLGGFAGNSGCGHHGELERLASIHEREWFLAYGIDPHLLALALWTNTGCIVRLRRVLEAHKRDAIRTLSRRRHVLGLST